MKYIRQTFPAAVFAVLLTTALPAAAQTQWFSSQLEGANEVGSTGDNDGWGVGVAGIGSESVAYYIWVTDIAAPTAAHIHTGAAGANGGIAVDFDVVFSDGGNGSYVAFGEVPVDSGTLASLRADPSSFYFNVHNSDHAAGAVRGQVLGGGPSGAALAATVTGAREVDNPGDPNGSGFAAVVFDDGTASFYFNVKDTAEPSAAHIHRGTAAENGSVVIDPSAAFTDGVAVASVEVDDDLEREILSKPHEFYFNVHTSEYPSGAVRGQLRATETVRIFPVISRTDGQAGSRWRTGLNVINVNDAAMTAWASWFPANDDGLDAADQTVPIAVGAAATEVVDDAINDLFGDDGNGALMISASEPFAAAAHVFNDQRDNPDIGGTFGLFVPAVDPSQLPESGILLLASNRPSSSGTGFRSNLVLFNPNPFEVDLILTALAVDGAVLGSDSMTLEPYMNAVEGVFRLIPSVPSSSRTQDAFTISYSANAPVAVALTPVDNATNDGFYVTPSSAPPISVSPVGNNPPNGTISLPTGNASIQENQAVNFEGSANDPDGDAMTYLWNFGDGITSAALVPGNHTYSDSGVYTVTFTVTDSKGATDPTPDSRTITVEGGGGSQATFAAVQSQIFTPSCAFSGCHGGSSPAEGMSLMAGAAYSNIVNVRSSQQGSRDRIEPNDPDSSYLYLKVTGDSSISGLRMPRSGPALSQQLIELLRDWIERGAPND
jgi:hypothetical protein